MLVTTGCCGCVNGLGAATGGLGAATGGLGGKSPLIDPDPLLLVTTRSTGILLALLTVELSSDTTLPGLLPL